MNIESDRDGRLKPVDVAIVLADGLSATAVQRHGVATCVALKKLLADFAWAPIVVAEQARVALGDEIGECLRARVVVMLIGERPGLSAADSLGAYLTFAPRVGRNDGERNCVSNIRPDGLPIAIAAQRIAYLLRESLRLALSGVSLKDNSASINLEVGD